MAQAVYPVNNTKEYRMAGPTDLIQLLPAPGSNSLFIQKWRIETFFYGIVHHEFIHLSGPTGSAKTSLIEALYLVPENFGSLCKSMGIDNKPFKLFPIEMVIFDTPGELIQRRGLNKGTTFDELSPLVSALREADNMHEKSYPAVWLREIGRVHTASIQGGLLNLMTKGEIILPGDEYLDGNQIAWIADSNYQAENDSIHTLVTFDDALKRRFTINLTLDYPSPEQEVLILQYLIQEGQIPLVDNELITKVVKLGQVIRRHRTEGNLQSVAPPTIYGYMSFIRMAHALSHLSLQQVAVATILGNASLEDQKLVSSVFNEVFGLQSEYDQNTTIGRNLF
jgi:hypothetical protein